MSSPKLDLNLFLTFDTIYGERNLTRAARMLHVTQPVVSNALKRLRQAFDDPLFIRTPHGVEPTPVADAISGQVREALKILNGSLREGRTFEPRRSSRKFSVSLFDVNEAFLLPGLMERLAEEAPGVSVECLSVPRSELQRELASAQLDVALDVALFSVPELKRRKLVADRYVCLLRPGHPKGGRPLSLETYLELGHVHVSARRRGIGHVDRALERLGRSRDIRLRMMNYLAAPEVVATTDLALTLPATMAAASTSWSTVFSR